MSISKSLLKKLALPAFACAPKKTFLSLENTIKLLKISADDRNLKLGKIIHTQLIISNQRKELNLTETNCLINFYAKCGEVSVARKLFDQMPERNVVSFNALMTGYLHKQLPLEVLELFKSMDTWELQPNEYIFATVLASCSDVRALDEGKQCHGHVLKSGLVFHQYVKNALIDMYSRCSDVKAALGVLKMVPGSDILSYNSIITGFLENGHLNEGLEVLREMVDGYLVMDGFTYVTVLGLCAGLKDLKLGMQIHSQILMREVEIDGFVGSSLIDMYGRCGKLLYAKSIFDVLEKRNVVHWTSMMAAYAQKGCFEDALILFLKMELAGVLPNEFTFAVMLNCCAGLSALRSGDLFNSRAEKCGFKAHLIFGNALINMYSKSGSIEDAQRVFLDMGNRNNVTWNAMISGYAHHGLGRQALVVFQQMIASFCVPDYITFVGVLSACGHLGLVDEGFYYLNTLMGKYRLVPGMEHYTCIIRLLGRAGLLDEAEKYMKSTPVQWDVVAWRTLLSACHAHQNISLGKRIADILRGLDSNDVATYILLCNMYAKAKRWDEVANIKKLLRGRGIKKEPGVSWIQVKNKTHVFVSEDKKHLESKKIHQKVDELITQIKMLGYMPDIGIVLHDVGDEQKEEHLSYHSEKLAIAFAVINTPSGAPIHVIKNLRMCDDCHSAVKLIAHVTERKIVVRDANREARQLSIEKPSHLDAVQVTDTGEHACLKTYCWALQHISVGLYSRKLVDGKEFGEALYGSVHQPQSHAYILVSASCLLG
ncbi:hypothetical protein C5167_015638 [Papaver somniferum]|uniref:DYW domain-containing protein n=1 Tax=Papaver somniferum TaxID=3469 RepID=A0A4Y7JAH9_PAPSO|nr:hypothetical protein C5167_015638 [Papaver somniferum]